MGQTTSQISLSAGRRAGTGLLAAAAMMSGLALFGGAALAQNNELRIRQLGPSNSLSVDQSEASGSFVGGLTLSPTSLLGSGFDLETSDLPTVLNELDASAAARTDARQVNEAGGEGNTLSVTVADQGRANGGRVLVEQVNTGGTANSGTVNLAGSGTVGLSQQGFGNDATVTLGGGALGAGVLQRGNSNRVDLTVDIASGTGLVIQRGSNNDAGNVTVTAVDGASVIYEQVGNNLAPVGAGAQVITNAPQVIIRQSNF